MNIENPDELFRLRIPDQGRLITVNHLQNLAIESELSKDELGLRFLKGESGGSSVELVRGEGSKIVTRKGGGDEMASVFFHTHPRLSDNKFQEDSRMYQKILPGHAFGDIDNTLLRMYLTIRDGKDRVHGGGLNILTASGMTAFVGHRQIETLDDRFYRWSIQNGEQKGFEFRNRFDDKWIKSGIPLDDKPILFKYSSGEWEVELYFLFLPWKQLYNVENEGLIIDNLVYDDEARILKERYSLRQPLADSLHQALSELSQTVKKIQLKDDNRTDSTA